MASDTKFFDGFEQYIRSSLHTTAPARVIDYYPNKHTADVQILYENHSTLIENAPVLKHVEPDIKKGSTVFVSFAELSLENMIGNQIFKAESSDTHDLNDAIVIGVWGG